jgi:hypothetical protein
MSEEKIEEKKEEKIEEKKEDPQVEVQLEKKEEVKQEKVEEKKEEEEQIKKEETKQEVKEEVKEEEVKIETIKPKEDVVKTIDTLAKLLLWTSQHKSKIQPAFSEINKNKEKLLNAFAEILDPNIYVMLMETLNKFNLISIDKLPKPSECQECKQPISEEVLNNEINFIINNKDIPQEKKELVIEKVKKIYSLDYETRINYLKTVLQKTIEKAEKNSLEGLLFFLKWLTIDTRDAAYEGMISYVFMAKPQYRKVWIELIEAFMYFANSFISTFIT